MRQTGAIRVLFSSTRGAGHLNPLLPFADACRRAGDEALICGPPPAAAAVESSGHAFWELAAPPGDELDAVWSTVPSLPPEEQNAVVIREIFGRLNTSAALPRLRQACEEWRPDVVVRETAEYGSALAAELHGIPHARVGIGLSSMEELGLRVAAAAVDDLRRAAELPADPAAETLRRSPYLTVFPASLEDPAVPEQPQTLRFHDPAWDDDHASELPTRWNGSEAPLVYVTFGSVAGGMEMAAHVYGAAMLAVSDLPVRALFTVGHDIDFDSLPPAPGNVRVERWVPQADVFPHAAAIVCHGGAGSTLGALAAGLPLVVVPLFADQPYNASRVGAVGAGLAVAPEPSAIRGALHRVLQEESYREAARRLAAEMRAQPSVDAAVDMLGALARGAPAA